MKGASLSIIMALLAFGISAQTEIMSNYNEAFAVLQKINQRYQYPNDTQIAAEHHTYEGNSYASGHFSYPEKRYELPVKYDILSGNDRFYIDQEMMYEGKTYQGELLLANDSCYTTDYWSGKKSIKKTESEGFMQYCLPMNVLHAMNSNKHSLHLVPSKEPKVTLGFNDFSGNKYYVIADAEIHVIHRIVQLNYSPTYGDTQREIRFKSEGLNNLTSPTEITLWEEGFVKESLSLVEANLPLDSLDSAQLRLSALTASDKNMHLELISEGLYLLKLPATENKVMVTVHDSFLSIYDIPGNIQSGNTIVDFLEKEFQKPVKYCFVSHHHPDHGGGVPSCYQSSTTIVTTKGNVDFFTKISSGNHTIREDVIARSFKKPQFELIDSLSNKTFFAKSPSEVQVFEIGSRSHHTDEYLVFYFPKSRVLFVPDLVFFSEDKVIPQKERAYSVYELISEQKLSVDKLVTGWPLRKGFRDVASMADLKEVLIKNYPDIK